MARPLRADHRSNVATVGSADYSESALDSIDLSVVIVALDDRSNLPELLPTLRAAVDDLGIRCETIIVTRNVDTVIVDAAKTNGARIVEQANEGFGVALMTGLRQAVGTFLLTMDADLSHPPEMIAEL